MRQADVARRILETSKIQGTFRLRSGKVSETYFDKYLFESDPKLLHAIVLLIVPLIPQSTEVVCGLEMGGIPVCTVLSQVTGLPAAFIRKARKSYGTEKFAEGPALPGRSIVLIEDVVSTGGALVEAASMLKADGIHASNAICVIDREMGGRDALAQIGVELQAVFSMSDIENAT